MSSLLPSQRSTRTPWKTGFAISALIHLVGILLYGGIQVIPQLRVTPSESTGAPNLTGMRVIELPPAEEDDEDEAPPEAPAEPTVPEASPQQAVEAAPVSEAPAPVTPATDEETEEVELRAAAERLRDIQRNPLLWKDWTDLTEVDLEERLTADLALEIRAFQDSLAAALGREEELVDWTWTDSDGGKWGFSPGKIHLGGITLPLPLDFSPNYFQRERNAERSFQDEELARQLIEGMMLETWKERIAAMRERAERERTAPRTGVGVPPPDTSGVGRLR